MVRVRVGPGGTERKTTMTQGPPPPGRYPPQPGGAGGLAENVASGLSYLLTWLTGLIFFFVDKRPEVRFHAMQAILFGVVWSVVSIITPAMPGLIRALLYVVQFAFFVVWIILLIQGFSGNHLKLPVVGDIAEQQAAKAP